MSVWQNLKDAFVMSAMHSPFGGGGLARARYHLLPKSLGGGYSNDQINRAIDAKTAEIEARHKNDHGLVNGVTSLVGSILGGVDPTYAIGGAGSTVARRMASQAAVQGATSLVRQKVNQSTGQRKAPISVSEALDDARNGALFQGGGEVAGKLVGAAVRGAKNLGTKAIEAVDQKISGPYRPAHEVVPTPVLAPDGLPGNSSVRPIDPRDMADIMNDPSAAGGKGADVIPMPQRRVNGRDRGPSEVISDDDLAALPPANREFLDASADKPVVDNTGYEAHTPYVEQPVAANDIEPVIHDEDLQPAEPEAPQDVIHDSELTPAEAQDMDASAPKPSVPDTYGEVPYEAPPAAANDIEPVIHDDDLHPAEIPVTDPEAPQGPLTSEGRTHGPFEEHPTDDPDGNKFLTYTTNAGDKLPIKMGIEPDGTAEIAIDQFGQGANKLGPAEIRQAMFHLQDMYPEIKKFGGYRRSGAGKGRVQEVEPAPRKTIGDLLNNEEGSFTPWGKPKKPKLEDIPEEELTPEQRVMKGIRAAEPVREAQEAAYRQERAKRFEAAKNIKYVNSGEAGFHQEMSNLSGDMEKLPSPYSIRPNLSQAEIDNLFDTVRDHPGLSYTDSIHARTGLQKLLANSGEAVPQRAELEVLRKVFPEDPKAKKTPISKWITDAINAPRSIMASMDLSAPLRQGLPLIHRKEYWSAFGSMFHQIGKDGYEAVQNEIHSRPTYHMMKDAGLSLTDVDDEMLSHHEERFLSRIIANAPVVGHIVKGSERAYTGFLNKLRADTFDSLIKDARDAGTKLGQKDINDIAKFINTSTGRGDLNGLVPKFVRGEFDVNKASPLLAGVLFSPRLMASRFSMLNPVYYAKLSPIARKEALKSLASTVTFTTTALGLAHMAGLKVGYDPRSTDFGKIRVGHTTYDMTGGFSSYLRLIGQELFNERVNSDGTKVKLNRLDTVGSFLRNKESPPLSEVHSMMKGVDNDYNKVDRNHIRNILKDVGSDFVPLVAQDTYGVYKDAGAKQAAISAVPDLFGVGVNTYTPKDKGRKTKFGGFDNGFGKGFKGGF